MSNGISFKFNFETGDYSSAYQLIQQVLDKIRNMETGSIPYRSVELSLIKPAPDQKTASLTIHTHDSVIREQSGEEDWSAAIDRVFEQVKLTNEHAVKLG